MDDRFNDPEAASPVDADLPDDGTEIIDTSINAGSPTATTALNDDAPGHDDPHNAHDIDALIARIREANDPKTITQINALLDHRNHLEPSPVGVTTVGGKPQKSSCSELDHTPRGSLDHDDYTVPLHSVRASLSPMRQETAEPSPPDTKLTSAR